MQSRVGHTVDVGVKITFTVLVDELLARWYRLVKRFNPLINKADDDMYRISSLHTGLGAVSGYSLYGEGKKKGRRL
jgi:hypothetical protein